MQQSLVNQVVTIWRLSRGQPADQRDLRQLFWLEKPSHEPLASVIELPCLK